MRSKLILTILLIGLMTSLSAHHQNPLSTTKTTTQMKYSILVLYKVTPQFLNLSRQKRGEIFEEKVIPIVQKYSDKLSVRLFDSEAFHAQTSDFLIISCNDLQEYYFFIEDLRDTELFGVPYIELNDVIIGIEDGFSEFESRN